ncbi:DNA protecting protein DprA [Candidatus Gottesmanbacteria bacterium RBG_16_37_8]|uniref:DNA protecting protein DprA n=1 Tax=Candidatus Gottesmanbacteria bacterium RBG_16_37_8 TaxID=1798371 RepID=A0A1F5YSS3_9BACT|nr:MAG: DNA protecting protein DprA [Candidatus Gottesmanbacteria bacterium RBG_16_37_8]
MGVIEIKDKNFPPNLKKITPKVTKLYFKGSFNKNFFQESIAVVGSRKMTQYGQRVIENLLPPLIDAGITIISGFMYGVDQAAHKVTLENSGKTVAVLGWGIDWPVENADQKLHQEIEKKGLIISEYAKSTAPQLWMFPRRNRIMAGLSQAVLIIEAAENSGSLITASYAQKYKRQLFAVPGPITSTVSQGTNNLIKSGQAKMVTSATDVLKEMNWRQERLTFKKETKLFHSITEDSTGDLILQFLLNEPLSIDEIALSTGQSVEKVSVKLSLLQLKGQVVEKEGKYYSCIK